jgi:hypothetical protein
MQHTENKEVPQQSPHSPPVIAASEPVLQDLCLQKNPIIIGLIAHLAGSALQEDIALTIQRLELIGRDVLIGLTSTKEGCYDPKVLAPVGT